MANISLKKHGAILVFMVISGLKSSFMGLGFVLYLLKVQRQRINVLILPLVLEQGKIRKNFKAMHNNQKKKTKVTNSNVAWWGNLIRRKLHLDVLLILSLTRD